MIELNLGSLFKGFNISLVFYPLICCQFHGFRKFVINLSALCFVVLLSLKLDGHLPVNWAFIFTPLWLCNILVFIGAVVASVSYCCRPPARFCSFPSLLILLLFSNDVALRTDFYSMLFTTLEHIFLFILVALIFVKVGFLKLNFVLLIFFVRRNKKFLFVNERRNNFPSKISDSTLKIARRNVHFSFFHLR